VLRNGLRVVSQSIPHARSVSVGLFVGVGSRHEDASHAGLSHLLEHLVFKGTRAYPVPGGLSEAIESVGGSVNASTDRELTVYTSKVPAAHAERAMEVVSELVAQPLLRHGDLSAEKPVIVDEIRMYVDSPGDHVFTMFDELLFGEHPLGREIAGTPRSVRRATVEAVRGHWAGWYRPERTVLSVAGAIDHATALSHAAAWWPDDVIARPQHRVIPFGRPKPVAAGAMRVLHRDLSQGNLCLGMPGVSRAHEDRWALDLLGAILGDGMSSRLFLELRERRSLAYDVSTFAASYADCGTFGVHAGFDPDQAEEVLAAIGRELERICSEPVAPHELDRARAYTRGRLELRMEDTGAVASWLGTGESLLPRILTVDEVVAHLEAVSASNLLRVAQRWIRPDLVRIAVLGPFRGRSRFARAFGPWLRA
jgi:predicted Zn-dependent peptidase